METRANYTLVGAFVLFFLVAIIAFILWVSSIGFSHNAIEYDIYFSGSVTGLKEGGTVLYRGVPVGTVESISLDPGNVEKVRATILLKGGVVIKEDAYASLELQGITGVSYIQLNGGTASSPRLRRKEDQFRPVIATKSSVLEEVTSSLPRALREISKAFEDIRPIFSEENRKLFNETLQDLHSFTHALAPTSKEDRTLQDFVKSLKEGMKDIREAAQEIRLFVKENRQSIISFTGTGLPALTKFLTEGQEAFGAVRRVSESLERSPTRFIYNDPKQGVKVQ